MDLIDRAKLVKAICNRECGNIISEIMQIKACIANAPTVDAVPVEEHERLKRELQNCRDELCLHCGNYKRSHLGACNGCRWKDGDE